MGDVLDMKCSPSSVAGGINFTNQQLRIASMCSIMRVSREVMTSFEAFIVGEKRTFSFKTLRNCSQTTPLTSVVLPIDYSMLIVG